MPTRLTGSGLARAHQCPSAFALPAVESDSDEARRGRVLHAYLQQLTDGIPPDEALMAIEDPALREWAAKIDRSRIPRRGESEVAVAYDVVTGQARRLVVDQHRGYDVAATEVPGTIDLVELPGMADVEVPTVTDWKTVAFDHDEETSIPQLEFYALALARITRAPEVERRTRVITEDGAIADGGTVRLDFDDLARIARRTRRAHDDVAAARTARAAHERAHVAPWAPDVREGPACRYCPCFATCPAKRLAIAMLLGGDVRTLTPEGVGRAHLAGRDARDAADRTRDVVRAMLDAHGELPTGDGRVVRYNAAGSVVVTRAA